MYDIIFVIFRFSNLADCHMARFKSLDVNKEKELERYKNFAEEIRPLVIETVSFLHQNLREGKHILVEGANAAMLDIDFGMPYIGFCSASYKLNLR